MWLEGKVTIDWCFEDMGLDLLFLYPFVEHT
jgi:hypothetical protein